MDSKKYNNIKLGVSIGKGLLSFILVFLFLKSGLSLGLENYLSGFIFNKYLLFIAYIIVISLAGSIISFPLSYYTEFYLEHKYSLSNQTFQAWLWEGAKGAMVSGVIGIPLMFVFYYVLNRFGNLWWLPFAIILFLVSVVLARVVPVLIMPLFYKITPLENEALKSRLERLASDAGLKLKNVFKFDMSKNTRKANAAFTGMGKSKRILLGDNLLDSYSSDEIETVIAHELGHYKYKHIIINIVIGTAFSFLTLYLLALLYRISIPWFGYSSITQVSAIPILLLWGMILGVVETPLTSLISRKHEYQADRYAISATGKAEAFISTLEKLNEQNLGDKEPHPVVEWFFYSHPSIKRRIAAIRKASSLEA